MIQNGNIAEGKHELQISQQLLNERSAKDESSLSGETIVQIPFSKTHIAGSVEAAEVKRFESHIGPAVASSYDNLGVHAAIARDYALAAGYFEHAALWNPSLPHIDNKWGRAAFLAQQYGAAVAPLSRELQTNPDDSSIRVMLGVSQYLSQNYIHALETLRSLEDHLDISSMPVLAYADSMARAGDSAQGILMLQEIIRNAPGNTAVHHALAEAYRRSGKTKEAELEDSLASSP